MEYLNKIEIRGQVGTVRIQKHNGRSVANLSIATTRVYRNSGGEPVMDTTWHNVNAWEGPNIDDLSVIDKGMKVYVVGRMSNRTYTGADGVDRFVTEVQATQLHILDDPSPLSYEA